LLVDVERARDVVVATAPPRLRLDELLRELGAHTGDGPPPERGAGVSVGELVDKAAEAGFGFLVGILSLIAIPFVGLSTPFGLAIALLGAQLMLGRSQPWLQKRARRRQLSIAMLDRVLALLEKHARWFATATHRRWEPLIVPRLVGVAIVVLALALALPIPIPGTNLIFLIPLFVYSLGVLERDGVWIAIGHALTLVDIALLFVLGDAVVRAASDLFGWLT
jgi:hypothetical protein